MIIKLLIITLMVLPNGLYKKSVEEVRGYKNLDQCLVDKGKVLQAYSNNKALVDLTVNCITIGEI